MRERSLSSRVARRATNVGAGCAAMLVAVYVAAVRTTAGQRFEDAVLRSAEQTAGGGERAAVRTLATVTAFSVVAAVAVVVGIALLRRRPSLAVAGAAVIAASVLTADFAQRSLLRPILLESGMRREDQSFPSGHAAVAMAVMCALVIVVPYRWRGGALLLASLWATAVNVATVAAHSHRPSDSVGSGLIVLCYTCVAVAVLAWRGSVDPVAPRTTPGRVARGVLVASYGAAALVALAGTVTGSAHTAGRAIALAGSVAVAVTLLALLHHVDLAPPARPRQSTWWRCDPLCGKDQPSGRSGNPAAPGRERVTGR